MGDMTLNFDRAEFACKCDDPECNEDRVAPDLVNRLQDTREALARSIRITSGCRCIAHNRASGGSRTSSHLTKAFNGGFPRCTAADLEVVSEQDAAEKIIALVTRGRFTRVGLRAHGSRMFIHVDIDPTKPHPCMWTYDAPA
jgi:uncharacterized protein YcbK (DUF882 family)